MENQQNGKTAELLLTVLTAALSLISACFLWKRTEFGAALLSSETRRMAAELTVLFLLFFVSFRHPVNRRASAGFRAAVTGVFLWLHRMFVPVVLTGSYILYLLLLGDTVLRAFTCPEAGDLRMAAVPRGTPAGTLPGLPDGAPAEPAEGNGRLLRLLAGLLTGSAVQIITVCVFSAFGIGGAHFFRIQVLITAAVLLPVRIIFRNCFMTGENGLKKHFAGPGDHRKRAHGAYGRPGTAACLLLSLILTMLLLQAGRIGIARDYDSLHYGLRSAYVLDNGRGIYENLGSVNDVYVYPKGFEILTLPLSGLRSDAYVPAFSWWMTVLTLGCAAAIVCFCAVGPVSAGRKQRAGGIALCRRDSAGLYAAAVLSCIPGIMNMAASAKTDAVTLTFQLTGVLFLLADAAGKQLRFPWTGLAAFVFTLALKPTSFLFSFLPALAGLGFWLIRSVKEKRGTPAEPRAKKNRTGILIFAFCFLAAAGVTARTVYLAGVPLTTAGTGLWQKLGFTLKYPFNGLSIGDSSGGYLPERLIGLFFCPVGEDMSHVYIAWGSLAVPVCGFFCLTGLIRSLRLRTGRSAEEHGRKKRTVLFLFLLLVLTGSASLYLLDMLWQTDGNYFMLLYALCVITAFGWKDRALPSGTAARMFRILLPALLLSAAMCMVTSWAGTLGFSTPEIVHAGFQNHRQEERDAAAAAGKSAVYDVLAEDPRNRVMALAVQPDCFAFPCNVQSYTDLEGSGGNVAILAHYEDFLAFLEYAQVDYLYVEDSFIAERPRASELLSYMADDELIRPVVKTESGVLYAFEQKQQDLQVPCSCSGGPPVASRLNCYCYFSDGC